MTTDAEDKHPLSAAQRKETLVAQGVAYRAGITKSKNAVRANLHADALTMSAVQHFAARSSAVLGTLLSLNSLRKGNLQALLPMLSTGVSLLAKRGAIKPLAGGIAVLAAVGVSAFFFLKRKRAKQAKPAKPAKPD
jgi:hypothetical protein